MGDWRRTLLDLLDAAAEVASVAWFGILGSVAEALDVADALLVVAGLPRGTAVFLALLGPAFLVAAGVLGVLSL